jgi:putative transposase
MTGFWGITSKTRHRFCAESLFCYEAKNAPFFREGMNSPFFVFNPKHTCYNKGKSLQKEVSYMDEPILHFKAFQFRLYPSEAQRFLIQKTIGCCRFVYNHFLAEWNHAYKTTGKGLSYAKCCQGITALKPTHLWLKEVDSIALQASAGHLNDAFQRFFDKQNDAPHFKSKKNPVQSYTSKYVNDNIAIDGNKVKLPKLGWVRFAKSREVEGAIVKATIRKNPSGKYFISIVCKTPIQEMPKTTSACGVDVGLKDFAICSDGTIDPNPKFFRSLEEKLVKAQRRLSRR